MMDKRLTLKKIEARCVVVPLDRPIVSNVGTFHDWPLILIDLHTHQGVIGRSYLEPYIAKAFNSIISVLSEFEKEFSGNMLSPIDIYEKSTRSFHLVGREGITLIAAAGLDMAIWDALAKFANQPLAVYLGGSIGAVPAYNSNGLWLTPVETQGGEARELVEEGGFKGLKIRLGREKLADDLAAVKEIRNAVGEDIKLMCDFNQGLNFSRALQLCHALDDQGLYWFEEPLVYDNISGMAELRRQLKTPLQIGENFYGPRALFMAIQSGASDLVMPDLMRIGGVTGWLRATAIAGGAGIPVSTHLYPEVSAHLMRVTETAHWLEWQNWADPVLQNTFKVKEGEYMIPDRPGNGIEWDEDAVGQYML